MIEHEGFYWLPILSKEMREAKEKLPNRAAWPEDFAKEYNRLRAEFTKARSDFIGWMRKDRDSRMNSTAKEVLAFLAESVNFDTGRCDPSHKTISDELGLSVRTIERAMSRIRQAGWMVVFRRGKMASNFYRLRVSTQKANNIIDYALSLREQRAEEWQARKRTARFVSDPTEMADHFGSDPTNMRGHEPTKMADHDPTKMAGKPLKVNHGDEPRKEYSFSDASKDTYPRESFTQHQPQGSHDAGVGAFSPAPKPVLDGIPSDAAMFGDWVRSNIPDPNKRREALRLLREQKMTPEILRGMAA